jgi:RimJ/RimL family protein N-acetyltransferase
MSEVEVRFVGVPERVMLNDGVAIRRYVEDDIVPLVDVVNASLDHLKPWMPWAQETMTVEAQMNFFRETSQQWDEGTNFVYGIFDPTGLIVGGTGFHVRNGPGVLEIGYWLAREAEGKGLMTRVVDALTKAAVTVDGVTRVEIHCDADNTRSAAIPKRLGYSLVRVEDREILAPGECGRHFIWAIAADEVAATS